MQNDGSRLCGADSRRPLGAIRANGTERRRRCSMGWAGTQSRTVEEHESYELRVGTAVGLGQSSGGVAHVAAVTSTIHFREQYKYTGLTLLS